MKFEDLQLPSNRKFGLFFTFIFFVLSGYFWLKDSIDFSIILLVLAIITLLVVLIRSALLLPFNKLWMRFGFILGKIISPLVLGVIFFLLIAPIAILMRLAGRDELRLKKKGRVSYWKTRSPLGPEPSSFKNQF